MDWEGLQSEFRREKRPESPPSVRYKNTVSQVRRGDIVVTHLTPSNTVRKEWKSSLVGASTVARESYQRGNTLYVETLDDLESPVPIPSSEYSNRETLSDILLTMIKRDFQKYLFEITVGDFCAHVWLTEENYSFLEGSVYADVLKNIEGPSGSLL